MYLTRNERPYITHNMNNNTGGFREASDRRQGVLHSPPLSVGFLICGTEWIQKATAAETAVARIYRQLLGMGTRHRVRDRHCCGG